MQRTRFPLLPLAAAVATVVWFVLLAHRALFDPDEGRYAEIPREMLAGGDWIIPHLNGLVYLEKPPLQYWLTALSFRLFGEGEFAARLIPGAAGYASLLLLYATARKLWGRRAALRALLYSLSSVLFVLLGHQLTLDMTLSACLLLALCAFLIAQSAQASKRRDAWMLLSWLGVALAVLDKGLIGLLIPGLTILIYLLWQRDAALLKALNLRYGVPLFLLIAAPWFVLAARRNPQFLEFFFIREHFLRYLTPIEQRTEPWWFFVPVLMVGILPWLPQALRVLAVPPPPRAAFNAERVLWIWAVFVLIFFSASDAKLIPYVLPAVPALALLCAARGDLDGRATLLAGALLSIATAAASLAYASDAWLNAQGAALLTLIRTDVRIGSALLFTGAALCLALLARRNFAAALGALCTAWFLFTASLLVAADAAQSLFSARDLALYLRREARAADPIYSVQSYEQSLPFYLKRPVVLVDYRDEFDLGLREDPAAGLATLDALAPAWLHSERAFAVMPPASRDRMAALGLPFRQIASFPGRVLLERAR